MRLLGNSILFADTNPEWKKRRVAFAPAFYKGKLIKLFDIAKECVRTTVKRWRTIEGGKPRTRFDFMEEMQMMSGRILLSCALGEDITEKINWVLLQTFGDCLHRMASPHTLMFPFLRYWYILPSERDNLANCLEIRKAI
jgi:cytochrome P450